MINTLNSPAHCVGQHLVYLIVVSNGWVWFTGGPESTLEASTFFYHILEISSILSLLLVYQFKSLVLEHRWWVSDFSFLFLLDYPMCLKHIISQYTNLSFPYLVIFLYYQPLFYHAHQIMPLTSQWIKCFYKGLPWWNIGRIGRQSYPLRPWSHYVFNICSHHQTPPLP